LTILTSYELMYEEDVLTGVPFGPIEPVPRIGLTMRENWLPTQLQANFIERIQRRVEGSHHPGMAYRAASLQTARSVTNVACVFTM
jgi:hypothetical protein